MESVLSFRVFPSFPKRLGYRHGFRGRNWHVGSIGGGKRSGKEVDFKQLEVLWDDGFGSVSMKDYLDIAKEMIKPDGGPPRWFSPVECGRPLKGSPLLLFLPGMDGVGLGLIMHHKALGKVFEVQCLHLPVYDRTPFEGLVEIVEHVVREEHASSPNKPIYLVGDSLGGCLALAVAARNPTVDLVLILANPATSLERSQLKPLFPILEAFPDELHNAVPYLLSFVMGEPVKMAMVNVDKKLPPSPMLRQLSENLTALLPRLSVISDLIPKDSLIWKLKLLKSAAAYANSRLHAVKAEEDGINLLTVIKATGKFRRSKKLDSVTDFVPPSLSEYKFGFDEYTGWLQYCTSPAMFSTLGDGKIVQGLSGVPNEGPVLLVGYHMLMGLELFGLVEGFLREKKIMVRGLAHPAFFASSSSNNNEISLFDYSKVFGALPVTATNLYRLLSTNSHILLYPGGAREALHYKGEAYKLFWPDRQEFVRMAAKFKATIVPFGVVGEDDIAELALDYNDLMKIPVVNDLIRQTADEAGRVRNIDEGEVGNENLFIPGLLPKIPGRVYYLFGKPIETQGKEELLKDKKSAEELYMQIKSEVESNLDYLLKKREDDPYRSIVDRTIYRLLSTPAHDVPSFTP
ncbi:phytyl ester synthase 1, chloroplastic isoform X2 [Spinacia oleracea]|uniref:Phytyl ester synthase 1, chloroplastic isoform X2 n=1 Tax=Spinacia oleracea TaxID=3562 RepID=A0ABM3RQT8_SPIOL|nr:phytyl ester synthase 1, chloroplastic-like isoform X2 [Spinacia oleracea]